MIKAVKKNQRRKTTKGQSMTGNSSYPTNDNITCTVQAPTRIDLAGGTLDIWPLAAILQEKFELWNAPVETVNMAIELRAEAKVTLRPSKDFRWHFNDKSLGRSADGTSLQQNDAGDFVLHRAVTRLYKKMLAERGLTDVTIETNAQAPRGSGLGGSSSLVIALLAAFERLLGRTVDGNELCRTAQTLEAGILGNLAGNQDHFAAFFGGLQAVQHTAFGTTTSQIDSDPQTLARHLVLAHSGQQHFSAFNNWLVLEKVLTSDTAVLERCAGIAKIVPDMKRELQNKNWKNVARLLSAEWDIRRTLAQGIITPVLESLYTTALRAGASGGKVCGAGGGGVLVMMVDDPLQKPAVEAALRAAGGEVLNCAPATKGVIYS
jgi:D-glycero-alpha-D-manno-heptose-7-phosphate kinase